MGTTNVAEGQAAPEVKEEIKPETTEVKSEAANFRKTCYRNYQSFWNKGRSKASCSEENKPKVRSRRAADDHNVTPIATETYLKDGEKATPEMSNPMVQLLIPK